MEITYKSIEEIVEIATNSGKKISDIVLEEQSKTLEIEQSVLFDRMYAQYKIMEQAWLDGREEDVRSNSGLTGGDAFKMSKYRLLGNALTGEVLPLAMEIALAISEWNAAMGRIVAAPTAGSCGILPAALLSLEKTKGYTRHDCVKALFSASAIGMVIANVATVSGAEGGCQAECGAASAMAAACIVELAGGTPSQVADAAAIALKCILGLVCDPVAGLVEIPCIKRNASGVMNAFMAAELALAQIESYIPVDEVIVAMKQVGNAMPCSLKETAEGGLATTPTGRKLCKKVFGI
ncbi:MAG: L-serine ammonia-lyase, iron-sulfur-dependent, subunit alpha [Lachnospiraceae bacterium]